LARERGEEGGNPGGKDSPSKFAKEATARGEGCEKKGLIANFPRRISNSPARGTAGKLNASDASWQGGRVLVGETGVNLWGKRRKTKGGKEKGEEKRKKGKEKH